MQLPQPKRLAIAMAVVLFILAPARLFGAETSSQSTYAEAIGQLNQAIHQEMASKDIRGVAVALVDDQQIVYAAGFGTARKDSIFRCGSISKLLNSVAVMQLVEQKKLDLDAPIERYGREFALATPFENASPVTLRQLLCHRSGVVRESPVGGYFDASEPSITETVASLDSCVLVNPPNTKTRYSNIGPTLAGQIVATVAGFPYDGYQRKHVLSPIGMTSSSFLLKGVPRNRVSSAFMRIADGRGGFKHAKAPLFDLGTAPAGNLYTTAEDLGRFISMLAAEGRAGGQQILDRSTLAQMFTPQLTTNQTGFGLGFMVGRFRGHKAVSHTGAVYGFTSSLVFLPEEKIGVVMLMNEDIVTGPLANLANLALSLMLQAKLGEEAPLKPKPIQLAAGELAGFAGEFESASYWAQLEAKAGQLIGNVSGQPITFVAVEPLKFIADGRLTDDSPITFTRDGEGVISGFTLLGQKFTRASRTAEFPASWKRYLGSYGPSFIPLVISVRNGRLYAMTENMVDYRLVPVNRHVFAFPSGLYMDEHLVFLTDTTGRVLGADLANMILRRR